MEDTDRLDARLAELTTQHEEATAKYEQYGEAVGEGGDIVILVERLRHFEELRAGIDAEIERLRAERDVVVVPSYDELRQSILDRSRRIELMDRDARADLVDIVEEIRAVPFQQFGGNKVVLRAAIHLNLTGLLPWTVRSYIESLNEGSECVSVTTEFQKLIWVDLFNASNSPRYAMKVRALREAGRKFADIAGSLGTSSLAGEGLLVPTDLIAGSWFDVVARGPDFEEIVGSISDVEVRPGPFEVESRIAFKADAIELDKFKLDREFSNVRLDLIMGVDRPEPYLDFDMTANGRDVRSVLRNVKGLEAFEQPFSLEGKGRLRGKRWDFERVNGTVGQASFAASGDLALDDSNA